MRDAATLEASGKPTAIVVNDVFAPIAHGTAALLALPSGYVDANIVWLPHPTSNLTADAVRALVDARIDDIRGALLGRLRAEAPVAANAAEPSAARALTIARETIAALAASLRADGADLVLTDFAAGVLSGELRIGELTCDDGSCIMPPDALAKMVEALVGPLLDGLREVRLREVRLERAARRAAAAATDERR